MNYTLYDPSTGKIIATTFSSDRETPPPDSPYIVGAYSGKEYYIDNGQAVAIPPNPSTLLIDYTFDWNTKTWAINIDSTAAAMRSFRNNLLAQSVDKINPVWYNSLTDEQKIELENYRIALLNVPQQTTWPNNVTWPTKPSWI